MTLKAAPILAIMLAAQASRGPGPAMIELPAWVRGGPCVIAGKAIQVQTGGERPTIDVPCADPTGVVSCDLDAAEPLDAPCQTSARPGG